MPEDPPSTSASEKSEALSETGTDSRSGNGDDETTGWLAQLKEQEERRRERQRLSEAKTVRFRKDDAEHISRKADELGISDAEYIRLVCSGRRPDVVAARQKVEQLRNLIERFAGAFTEADEERDLQRLRHIAEEMERQADEIAGE